MRALFVSDAHYPLCGDGLINLLFAEYHRCDRIYVLGDLFEFYFGYGSGVYRHHLKLLNAIEVVSSKCKVYMFEGNHEYLLNRIRRIVNVRVVNDWIIDIVDGVRIYMSHGDTVDKTDRGYAIFRGFVKNSVSLRVLGHISPIVLLGLSRFISSWSRARGGYHGCSRCDRAMLRFAASALCGGGIDVVMLAHSHTMRCVEMEKGVYINTGAYLGNEEFVIYDSDYGFQFYRGGNRIWTLSRMRLKNLGER